MTNNNESFKGFKYTTNDNPINNLLLKKMYPAINIPIPVMYNQNNPRVNFYLSN